MKKRIDDCSTAELLEELLNRDAIAVLQTTQRIEGVKLMQHLGAGDDIRAEVITFCQRMAGRAIADAIGVQHITHRKLKTSASEDIQVTVMMVRGEHIKALAEPPFTKPEEEAPL